MTGLYHFEVQYSFSGFKDDVLPLDVVAFTIEEAIQITRDHFTSPIHVVDVCRRGEELIFNESELPNANEDADASAIGFAKALDSNDMTRILVACQRMSAPHYCNMHIVTTELGRNCINPRSLPQMYRHDNP